MKNRYTIIDNKTRYISDYSEFTWWISLTIIWLLGILVGAVCF